MNLSPQITLVYPIPTQDSPIKGPALSIFYPGASLEKAGFKVAYFDERFDSPAKMHKLIRDTTLFIGVSSLTGYQLRGALKILKEIKSKRPDLPTVMGGVHPSLLPRECLEDELVDIVVIGEGEETLVELARQIQDKGKVKDIKGIAYKEDGKIILNPDRPFLSGDEWPFPLTRNNFFYFEIASRAQELFYFSSRGCPHRCRFCYNQVFNSGRWRPMPIEKFGQEIGELVDKLKFRHIYINDDNIGGNVKRLSAIVSVLKKHNLLWATCGRASDINPETVSILEGGGCQRIFMGVETGSERILKEVIGKDYPGGVEDIRESARLIAKSAIRATYSFMCNIPSETRQELEMSMDLADWIHQTDSKSSISFYVYAPYPGTPLYEEALTKGFIPPRGMEAWSRMSLSNSMDAISENLFYISGLRFRGGKGDTTSKNFPGWRRAFIKPFELLAKFRWPRRCLTWYNIEKPIVKFLFRWASQRRRD